MTVPRALAPMLDRCREEGRTALAERESKAVLEAAGLPVVEEVVVCDPDAAVAAADRLGPRVVVKGDAPSIAHKTDRGLVHAGLEREDAVRSAVRSVLDILEAETDEAARVLVQPHIDGVETALGVHHDDQFGPMLAFGAGGVLIELVDDVVLRRPPVSSSMARTMIDETRVRRLLDGHRGHPRADVPAVVAGLKRLGRFAVAADPLLASIDVNPFAVRAAGAGAVALDARLTFRRDAIVADA